MNHQPDQFFKEKLKDHLLEADVHVWNRVSEKLTPKHRFPLWLKVAAVVLPLGIAAAAWFALQGGKVTNTRVAQQETPARPEPQRKESEPNTKTTESAPLGNNAPVASVPSRTRKQSLQKETVSQSVREIKDAEEPMAGIQEDVPSPITTDVVGRNITAQSIEPIERESPTSNDETTIFYSVKEASRFFNEGHVADATPEEQKTSKLQRLVDLTDEIHPVSELRQFKNEILAFNFKNEKQNR